MKFGIVMFPADYAVDVVTLGRALEARGFDSLFLPEHTHIPTSRRTPWPGGAELPREYSHTLDPFVGLAACGRWRQPELRGGLPCPAARTSLPLRRAPTLLALDEGAAQDERSTNSLTTSPPLDTLTPSNRERRARQ